MSQHLIKDSGDLAMKSGSANEQRAMRTQRKQDVAHERGNLGTATSRLPRTGLSEQPLTKRTAIAGSPDPLYLFACKVEWRHRRNLGAYQALVAALDERDHRIRLLAEMMLHRGSPRPQRKGRGVFPK
jgi:hypothetical protein